MEMAEKLIQTETISVKVDVETKNKLIRMAEMENRTVSGWLKNTIKEKYANLEKDTRQTVP